MDLRRAGRLGRTLAICALFGQGCDGTPQATPARRAASTPAVAETAQASVAWRARAERMVREQIEARGVRDARVLDAMRSVPRHAFVALRDEGEAYDDHPLPIEAGQTVSQPYIVALMTELASVSPGERVLEVGTGSGYQAAVLDVLGAEVYSIEIVETLAASAAERLARLGYARVHVRHGDGYAGSPEHAPFDAIIVTAAPPRIPEPLRDQLAVGGKLVVPVGRAYQELVVIERTADGFRDGRSIPVRFVPMTGRAQEE